MIKKIVVGLYCLVSSALALADFPAWQLELADKALGQGVSKTTVRQFLGIKPYHKAQKHDSTQAEFQKTVWSYVNNATHPARVKQGAKKYADHLALLQDISELTGVSPEVLIASWGMESNYGRNTGHIPVVSALATLAYESRRKAFFEKELLMLLQLIDKGDVPSINVKGSWAGGLGMVQFIPSTYMLYAKDFSGDGHRNLWQISDALASAGHYLQAMGWRRDIPWGMEVRLPASFEYMKSNELTYQYTVADWSRMGVTDARGKALTNTHMPARLFVPAGRFGPKFLLSPNFDVIKRYNNSDAYALSVSLLSDRIIGKAAVVAKWPANDQKLTNQAVKELQVWLNDNGYEAGSVDGMFGQSTRRALQRYQQKHDLIADGFLSKALYKRIRE